MREIAGTPEAGQVGRRNGSRRFEYVKRAGLTFFALVIAPVIAFCIGKAMHIHLDDPLVGLALGSALLTSVAALLTGYRAGAIVFGIIGLLGGVTPIVAYAVLYVLVGRGVAGS